MVDAMARCHSCFNFGQYCTCGPLDQQLIIEALADTPAIELNEIELGFRALDTPQADEKSARLLQEFTDVMGEIELDPRCCINSREVFWCRTHRRMEERFYCENHRCYHVRRPHP